MKVNPNDPFTIHEALHTTHLARQFVEDNLRTHPAIEARPELSDLASQASKVLAELYQALGGIPAESPKETDHV